MLIWRERVSGRVYFVPVVLSIKNVTLLNAKKKICLNRRVRLSDCADVLSNAPIQKLVSLVTMIANRYDSSD